MAFTADKGCLWPLFKQLHNTDWTSDCVLRSTLIMPSWKKGTTCRANSHVKQTWYSERHPVLALFADLLKPCAAQRIVTKHRRLPLSPRLGIRARSTPGKIR